MPEIGVNVTGQTEPGEIYVNTNFGKVQLVELFGNVANIGVGVYSFSVLNPNWDGIFIFPYEEIDQTTTLPQLYPFNLDEINEMKMDILSDVKSSSAYSIGKTTTIEPYKTILNPVGGKYPLTSSQEGLLIKTYQSDLFNNWLNTAAINNINNRAQVSTTGGGFTMEAFL